MIINLNILTKVQLSDFGRAIWLSQIDNLPEEIKTSQPQLIDAIRNAIAPDGTLQLQLWEVMQVFGPYLNPTNSPFVTNTIEVNRRINFDQHNN